MKTNNTLLNKIVELGKATTLTMGGKGKIYEMGRPNSLTGIGH